jgi:PKD repeat protein
MIRRAAYLLLLAPILLAGCNLTGVLDEITNAPPEAVATASTREGPAPLEVEFDARGSWDDNEIVSYQWDFGDPHDVATPQGTVVRHTYSLPGTYIAKLAVMDAQGEISIRHITIRVGAPPPIAEFTVNNKFPPAGSAVTFDARDSRDPDGGELTYAWDFGDGGTGVGIAVSHIYDTADYYTVILTVTDDEGMSASEDLLIIVQGGVDSGTCLPGGTSCGGGSGRPSANVNTSRVSTGSCNQWDVHVGEPVVLDGSGSLATDDRRIISYDWDFGDGERGSGPIVEHIYMTSEWVTLMLTVTDDAGRQDSADYTFFVKPPRVQ